jgi:hypothetical protein
MSIPEVGFAIPGDIDTRTGGYGYDRRLIVGLRAQGFAIRHLAWPDGFPSPDGTALAAAARSLASQPDGRIVIVDGPWKANACDLSHSSIIRSSWKRMHRGVSTRPSGKLCATRALSSSRAKPPPRRYAANMMCRWATSL